MRTLVTPLVRLEPQVQAHAAEMFELLCDPAIYEFEREPPPSLERLAAGYQRLESRQSPDGSERWLNWIVRLHSGEATGYVQATVLPAGRCVVGYEFGSRFWRRGIASAALQAMFAELAEAYQVHTLVAELKAANYRSLGLLRKLGFVPPDGAEADARAVEPDEILLLRPLQPGA